MATLATTTEKKTHVNADEKPERKPQRPRVDDRFKIFCGTANEALADEVCAFLGMARGQALERVEIAPEQLANICADGVKVLWGTK